MYRLLIVDDEILVADAIFRELSTLDPEETELSRVYSAEDAKELLDSGSVDVVLCDIEMPGVSGLELLEWIRGFHPQVEVIMLTCHAEFDYLRQAMRMGCFDYVLKPVDYQELSEIIRKAEEKIDLERRAAEEGLVSKEQQAYLEQLLRTTIPDNAAPSDSASGSAVSGSAVPGNAAQTPSADMERADSLEIKVKHYIREHMMEPISVSDIADHVGFSASHLMKTFKAQTGTSILQYLTCERLDAAKELLVHTDLPVSEIGIASGYDNYSYFIKLFKRETGMTPMKWRKTQAH